MPPLEIHRTRTASIAAPSGPTSHQRIGGRGPAAEGAVVGRGPVGGRGRGHLRVARRPPGGDDRPTPGARPIRLARRGPQTGLDGTPPTRLAPEVVPERADRDAQGAG